VRELTELQGTMGTVYARAAGEPDDVAAAIAEHYLPRAAGAEIPPSDLGIALAIADRLDTLVAAFAAGLEPTGSADPYGLRRAGLTLLSILVARRFDVSMRGLIDLAARRSPKPLTDERRAVLEEFLTQRLRVWLVDQGNMRGVVEAVIAAQADRPGLVAATVARLEAALASERFQRLMAGVKRADRIAPAAPRRENPGPLQEDLLREPAEQDLLRAYREASTRVAALPPDDVNGLVDATLPLADPIDRFFADIMVMAEDEALRAARLDLLQRIRDLPRRSFEAAQVPLPR
jgi:glycyl-tRNA synthetase beta subunit